MGNIASYFLLQLEWWAMISKQVIVGVEYDNIQRVAF